MARGRFTRRFSRRRSSCSRPWAVLNGRLYVRGRLVQSSIQAFYLDAADGWAAARCMQGQAELPGEKITSVV
jgi:hypothetical protein